MRKIAHCVMNNFHIFFVEYAPSRGANGKSDDRKKNTTESKEMAQYCVDIWCAVNCERMPSNANDCELWQYLHFTHVLFQLQ